jgi:hypothetical protein
MKKVTNTLEESRRDPKKMLLAAMISPDDHIEKMEKRGQEEFVESDVFPTDLCGNVIAEFEALGFEFLGPVPGDDLFQFVALPKGWARKGSDHDMWSYIIDEIGRERVAIFYKAAFYDRRARASIESLEEEK